MSQPCAIETCKRLSRALCHCCQQNLCMIHLSEHNDLLNAELNPLIDEINALGERLKSLNINDFLDDCHQKLEQWRQECHNKIDDFVTKKRQELDRLVVEKLNKQQEDVKHTQSKLVELIRNQEATRQDINTLTSTICQIETEINKVEKKNFSINTCPLLIDNAIIQVKEISTQKFDSLFLSSVCQTMVYPPGSWRSLATNGRLLLIYQAPNFCFLDPELKIVKQVLWPHGAIRGICWSSTSDCFIVITKNDIFLLNENTMSITSVATDEKQEWFSCTCFNDQLFLSQNVWGSPIIEMNLSPPVTVTKKWKSPASCKMDENIHDIVSNDGTLAVVIRNKTENSMRLELRSSTTLNCLRSVPLDVVYQGLVFRCCSFDSNGWLVADSTGGNLLYITADGNMQQKIPYNTKPYYMTLFGSNMLAVSSESSINFHKI